MAIEKAKYTVLEKEGGTKFLDTYKYIVITIIQILYFYIQDGISRLNFWRSSK